MTEQPATALCIRPRDNVATCVLAQRAGQTALFSRGAEVRQVTLLDDIPFGHKFAVCDIEAGGLILKYGHPIGRAVRAIRCGEHVHVHNVQSLRCGAEEGD